MLTIRYFYFIFLCFVLWVFACQKTANQQVLVAETKLEIPELLDRSELLGTPEERVYIQETYRNLVEKISKDNYDHDSKLKLAQLFMLEARVTGEHGHYYPAALHVLDHSLAQNAPKSEIFQAMLLETSVYLSLHQFQKALTIGEEAIKLNPYNALIHGALVDAHVELGNYDKAVELADKMVSIRPDMRSYARVSYLREIHGDIEGAIEAMEMAVKAGAPGYEDVAWCRLTLGDLLQEYGDITGAEVQYRQTLAERPNYPFAIAALSDIEKIRGNFDKAEQLLDEACEIIPEVGFYEQKARLYTELGRDEEADAIVDEILLMLADDEANGHKMGLEYATLYRDLIQDQDRALEYAQSEYELRPKNIDVNHMLASIYLKQGKVNLAQEHIQKANITNSQDPELTQLTVMINQYSSR